MLGDLNTEGLASDGPPYARHVTQRPMVTYIWMGTSPELDAYEGGDHNRFVRWFPTNFLCLLQSLGMIAVDTLSSNYIRLVDGVGVSHGVKGLPG
ncbi:hypothetical protein TNCV_5048471 [Trichonephila clavipes]|nr:hypothetical protein TNCV_5048471 [Trichonephila clavipes]